MRHTHCLVLSFLFCHPALADVTLVQDTLLKGVRSRTTMWVKGDKLRTDNDTTTSVIIDAGTGDMTTLVHEQKMVIKVNTRQLQELAAPNAGADLPAAPVTRITATGETETIDGHLCEIYLSENQGMVVKLWVARNYPGGEKLREELKMMAKLSAPNAPQQPEVPGIAIQTEFEQQGLQFTTRLVSLSAEPVDESRFVIPADYKAP